MAKYIIGIDGGSQSTKIVIFDTTGKIVCEGKEALKPMHLAANGVVEHPGDDLWNSLVAASKRAFENFPYAKEDIIGVGVCTIRFCRALLKKDGSLAEPVLSWMDARVSRPYEHENPEVAYVTASSGYITHRLTGEFKDTAASYQGEWPIDTDKWAWSEDEDVLKAKNIPREMLFELKMPGEILGTITKNAAAQTGLPEGIPVVATANDKAVEALGAGLVGQDIGLVSLGTYIAGMIKGTENPKGTKQFWTNFASLPNQYLYESNGIRRGMWTVSWFKCLIGDDLVVKGKEKNISPEDILNQEALKTPAGSDGLMTVLDFLAPADKPYKKGLMIGFDARHTRGHIYRSILEAIALTMKTNLDRMTEELGICLNELIITGGGSSSHLMMQIFADVFGIKTVRNQVNGAASLGAAICVAKAADVYPDFQTAIQKMVKIKDSFLPDEKNHQLYQKMNQIYPKITNYTDEILKESYPLFK